MSNPVLPTPVDANDPCGPDLHWDPATALLIQALQAAVAREDDSVVDAERTSSDAPTFEDIVEMAQALGTRTKDLRVLAIHAEACWRARGLAAFAAAMEDLAAMIETWPDPGRGIHPRCDEEEGDLGERAAPLGRLLNLVPTLASSVGWGGGVQITERTEVCASLRGVFEAWEERLGPAFGRDLPSCRDAWNALLMLVGDTSESERAAGGMASVGAGTPPADAWDLIERAAELMARQQRHSPALPVLRLLAKWRSLGIIEIADAMKSSGISLETFLESIKRQLQPPP